MTTAIRSSRTAALLDDLRRSPAFRALVPMEALLGWPIPLRHREPQNRLYAQLLPHGQRAPERRGDPTALFAPLGVLTVTWPTGQVVGWSEAGFLRSWTRTSDPVADFPHDAVRDLPIREYLARREELLGLYDDVFDAMATDVLFDGYERFATLLTMLMPPGLLPWYRSEAPRFVERFFGPAPATPGQ
jgi:hypothetical protein